MFFYDLKDLKTSTHKCTHKYTCTFKYPNTYTHIKNYTYSVHRCTYIDMAPMYTIHAFMCTHMYKYTYK